MSEIDAFLDDHRHLNDHQRGVVKRSLELFLSLPWDEREDAFSTLRFNDIFCSECGIGGLDRPNANCQCTNDE